MANNSENNATRAEARIELAARAPGDYSYVHFQDLDSVPPNLTLLADKKVSIYFNNCNLSGMEVLKNLPNLSSLNLSYCRNVDVDIISELTNIKGLDIRSREIFNPGFLAYLHNLTSLEIHQADIDNLSSLSSLKLLKYLYLSAPRVRDIESLSASPKLEGLWLLGTQVRSLDALERSPGLRTLNIDGSAVEDVSVLSKMPDLYSLNVSSTNIRLIPELKASSLRYLDCGRTQVDNLEFARNLSSLESLNISGTRISSIEPIKDVNSLIWLSAADTPLSDLSPLARLRKLGDTQRGQSFKTSTVKNIAIVLTAGASIAALPITGASVSGVAGGLVGARAGYIAMEGLKKSEPFLEVAGLVKQGINNLTELEASRLLEMLRKQSLEHYLRFVEANERLLRKIADVYRSTKWLDDHLEWIKDIRGKRD